MEQTKQQSHAQDRCPEVPDVSAPLRGRKSWSPLNAITGLFLVTFALVGFGCGTDSSGGSDEDQIRDLVSQSASYLADNEYGNYCELLSPAAVEEIESTDGFEDASCEGIMAFAGSMVSDSDIEAMTDPESIEVNGEEARISYPSGSELDSFRVEKIDGTWLIGPTEGGDPEIVEDSDEPTKTEVKAWPAKFCSLKEGMTRDQVREVMGEPTSEYFGADANQDEWDGYHVSVTAFYDIDDRVQQLDDSTGTSELPCDY